MTYLVLTILGVTVVAVGIATPLTVLLIRYLDQRSKPPASVPAPVPETPSGSERIDRIARRGRR